MDELDLAYQELVRGSLPVAERRYRDLLAKDRLNPDIWTGLGAVLLRLGKPEEAESMFRRAQELNPTDPYTRAMLLSLSRSPDAYKDSQYTTLANNAGQSASQAAAFALLAAEHAAAKRWNEAQQAFFNALTADPGNPDYAYNLAVTLEHMRQPRLAYDFYRQALEFAKSKRPGFDLPRAQSRLLALKPAE
jgi:Flp pilus assembly protein TadD